MLLRHEVLLALRTTKRRRRRSWASPFFVLVFARDLQAVIRAVATVANAEALATFDLDEPDLPGANLEEQESSNAVLKFGFFGELDELALGGGIHEQTWLHGSCRASTMAFVHVYDVVHPDRRTRYGQFGRRTSNPSARSAYNAQVNARESSMNCCIPPDARRWFAAARFGAVEG